MLSLLKRYRELFVVALLLLYPFGQMMAHGETARSPNLLDRGVLAATAPVERGVTGLIEGIASAVRGYVALRGAHQAKHVVEEENAALRGQVAALEEARLENERLRKILDYEGGKAPLRIVARVIGLNPASTLLSVRIDRGETDGVRRGMAVVTPDGVVGQVLRSVPRSADVLLITDGQSRLGVRVQRSRARGTAVGAGGDRALKLENDGALRLENVLRTDDLQEGDRIVTSGTDGIFPSGLTLGRAAAVRRKKSGMFQDAEIVPAVDLSKVEEVMVIVR